MNIVKRRLPYYRSVQPFVIFIQSFKPLLKPRKVIDVSLIYNDVEIKKYVDIYQSLKENN